MAQQYVIFIIEQEWDPGDYTADDFHAVGDQHRAFAAAVEAAGGKVLGGNALQPSATAVRIQPAAGGGDPVFTDGPFPELKELITGYYVIEVDDLPTAKRLAALCPTDSRLELWPVFDTTGM